MPKQTSPSPGNDPREQSVQGTSRTPSIGPWYLGESSGGAFYVYGPESRQPIRPQVKIGKRHTRREKANALLFAAAWQLREAVFTAFALCEHLSNAQGRVALTDILNVKDQLEQALLKANGIPHPLQSLNCDTTEQPVLPQSLNGPASDQKPER